MFKKTLVALALTGLAGVANAAKITDTDSVLSLEGIAKLSVVDLDVVGAGTSVVAKSTLTGSTAYQEGDKVSFTFPNDTFAIGTDAKLAVSDASGVGANLKAKDGAVAYTNGNTVTFTLVGGAGAAVVGEDATFTLTGVKLEAANLQAGGKVAASFKAISTVTGGAFDETKAVGIIAEAKSQYSLTTAKDGAFDAVVDVTKDRLVFSENSVTDTTDELKLSLADDGSENDVVDAYKAKASKIVYTLNGDFSFLDTDGDGKVDNTPALRGLDAGTVKTTYGEGLQSIIVTQTVNPEASTPELLDKAPVITLTATDGKKAIDTQEFNVDAVVTYKAFGDNTADSTKSFSLKAGQWKLNGYEGVVSFLPFGGGAAQLISVTNSGTLEGQITGELIVDGEVKSIDLGLAKAKAVTNVGKLVKQYAADNAIVGNYAVKIIVDAPTDNITVEGIYFLDGDRVLVPTKSNKAN